MVVCDPVRATFIHLQLFVSRWKRLRLDDDATRQLEEQIMQDPSAAPIIRGTGGARKIRFAPASWHAGKSGSIRVIYAFFEQHQAVLLITAYGKSEKSNISPTEAKAIKTLLDHVALQLGEIR